MLKRGGVKPKPIHQVCYCTPFCNGHKTLTDYIHVYKIKIEHFHFIIKEEKNIRTHNPTMNIQIEGLRFPASIST